MSEQKLLGFAKDTVTNVSACASRFAPTQAFDRVFKGLAMAAMITGATPLMSAAIATGGEVLGASPRQEQLAMTPNTPNQTNVFHFNPKPAPV